MIAYSYSQNLLKFKKMGNFPRNNVREAELCSLHVTLLQFYSTVVTSRFKGTLVIKTFAYESFDRSSNSGMDQEKAIDFPYIVVGLSTGVNSTCTGE